MSTTNIMPALVGPDGKPLPAKPGSPMYKENKIKKAKDKANKPATNNYVDEKVAEAVNGMPGVISKSKSLTGLPLGTEVNTGGATTRITYSTSASRERYAAMDAPARRNLLLQMSKIPGLYPANAVPTLERITSTGGEFYGANDFAALDKLMAHADLSGQTYQDSLIQFSFDPESALAIFGPPPKPAKAISLSNPAALELDLNNKFLDLFDEPANRKTAKAYAAEMIKAQQAAGGANRLDPVLSERIFRKYVTKKANTLVSTTLEDGDANTNPITEGAFGMTITKLRNAYFENYLPINEKKVYKDAIAASRSPQALQNVLQNIQMKAIQYYPAVAEGIRNGQTVSDLLDAPINSYASVFGVKANQVPQSFLSKIASGTSIPSQDDVDRIIYSSDGIEKAPGYRTQQLNDFKTMFKTFGIGPT
jgi:hypothetical protein